DRPRRATEMADWLRRLGDLLPSEVIGEMPPLLKELETDGRACRIDLPAGREPARWVLKEEEALYRRAFGLEAAEPGTARKAAETILLRFLETRALGGLSDVLDRCPFDRGWAKNNVEEWARGGRVVAVSPPARDTVQWSLPENLDQVQRGSLAILRREVVTVPPARFADFVLRWQRVHPDTRRGSAEGLTDVLSRLRGLPLPAELWEQAVLPRRVPGYQPRWLDVGPASRSWAWYRSHQ